MRSVNPVASDILRPQIPDRSSKAALSWAIVNYAQYFPVASILAK